MREYATEAWLLGACLLSCGGKTEADPNPLDAQGGGMQYPTTPTGGNGGGSNAGQTMTSTATAVATSPGSTSGGAISSSGLTPISNAQLDVTLDDTCSDANTSSAPTTGGSLCSMEVSNVYPGLCGAPAPIVLIMLSDGQYRMVGQTASDCQFGDGYYYAQSLTDSNTTQLTLCAQTCSRLESTAGAFMRVLGTCQTVACIN